MKIQFVCKKSSTSIEYDVENELSNIVTTKATACRPPVHYEAEITPEGICMEVVHRVETSLFVFNPAGVVDGAAVGA